METQAHFQPTAAQSAGVTLFEAYMQWVRAHEARTAAVRPLPSPKATAPDDSGVRNWGVPAAEASKTSDMAPYRRLI